MIFHCNLLVAQNQQLDSLKLVLSIAKEDTNKVNTLLQLAWAYQAAGNDTTAIEYANKSLVNARKLKFLRGEGHAYFALGRFWAFLYDFTRARVYYYESIRILESIKHSEAPAGYVWIAESYRGEDNYPETIKNYFLAIRNYEKLKDTSELALTYCLMAGASSDYGNHEEGLKYAKAGRAL